MKTMNNGNDVNVEFDLEQLDTNALKKRILAYRKMSEAMQRAAEAIRSKGGAKA